MNSLTMSEKMARLTRTPLCSAFEGKVCDHLGGKVHGSTGWPETDVGSEMNELIVVSE
jgi:hypothetical protein